MERRNLWILRAVLTDQPSGALLNHAPVENVEALVLVNALPGVAGIRPWRETDD